MISDKVFLSSSNTYPVGNVYQHQLVTQLKSHSFNVLHVVTNNTYENVNQYYNTFLFQKQN